FMCIPCSQERVSVVPSELRCKQCRCNDWDTACRCLMNFVRNTGGISCRGHKNTGIVVKISDIGHVTRDLQAWRSRCPDALRLVDAGNDKRNIIAQFCANLRKNLFQEPDDGIAIRTGFLMNCTDKEK